jgi:hypothetical protein
MKIELANGQTFNDVADFLSVYPNAVAFRYGHKVLIDESMEPEAIIWASQHEVETCPFGAIAIVRPEPTMTAWRTEAETCPTMTEVKS